MSDPIDLTVVSHPLVATRLTTLRDADTPSSVFRVVLAQVATLLVYEATRGWSVNPAEVRTPVAVAQGVAWPVPPVIVPVLRAGLGMAEAALELFPDAAMGFVGMARDEVTARPSEYLRSLPDGLDHRPVLVLDPMIATGGSLAATLAVLVERGARDITVASVVTAPEGLATLRETGISLRLVTAALDAHLNENKFIVPGLGDAGDRQFGTAIT